MVKKERIYTKMAGRPFFSLLTKTLWKTEDHLLYVESIFFRERYRRFYFKDIQSILLQRTQHHQVWSFVCGALAAIFGLILLLASGFEIFVGICFALFFGALIINLFMGPGCTVHLQTAVQLQKIGCLKRVSSADKVLTQIKTMIEEKQGQWNGDIGPAAPNHTPLAAPSSTAGVLNPAPVKVPASDAAAQPKGPYKKTLHQALFGMLLSMGLIGMAQMILKSLPLGLMVALLHAVAFVLSIIALARWFRHLKGTLVGKFNRLAVIFLSIQTVVGYGLLMTVSFQHPTINYHHWSMFKKMFDLQMSDHSWVVAGNIFFAAGALLLGAFGLLVAQRAKIVQSGECQPHDL